MEKAQLFKYIQTPTLLTGSTLSETRQLTKEFPWFQVGWILYLRNLKNVNSPDYNKVLKKVAVLVPDRKRLYKYLNSELDLKPVIQEEQPTVLAYQLEDVGVVSSEGSLIDKFLSADVGSLKNAKNGNGTSVGNINKELLDKSVLENDELVTETLANIYYEQKNFDKALDAYEKLSLKFPEKSVYFASRIEEIRVIKNNI
jgi:tetratricopeptide (TPR) repeat protein